MSYILNIDTALEVASICLSKNGTPLTYTENYNQREHSSWLHTAIKAQLEECNCSAKELDAISVNTGPGSYTGIRIGLSAAKGLCYALNKPLITISSLELIAFANKETATNLICPVIDARRMEIYYSVYTKEMIIQEEAAAHIVTADSFHSLLATQPVLFCGTGSEKLQATIHHLNATFAQTCGTAKELASIAFRKFSNSDLSSLSQTDPLYIKDFYTSEQKR